MQEDADLRPEQFYGKDEGAEAWVSPTENSQDLRQLVHKAQQHLTVIMATSELAQFGEMDEPTRADFQLVVSECQELRRIMERVDALAWGRSAP